MSTTDTKGWGRGVAVAHDHSGHSAPNPNRVSVEKLGVSARGLRVRFTYRAEATHSTVFVKGTLEQISRPIPVPNQPAPTLLQVDRLWHAVPAGTLVTIEELR